MFRGGVLRVDGGGGTTNFCPGRTLRADVCKFQSHPRLHLAIEILMDFLF